MKTRSIARGIVGSVAALLGVMAAGCSADVSDPQSGEAEIGSTAEALTTPGRDSAASCIIVDSDASPAKTYMIVAGGFTSSPAATDIVDAYKFGTGGGWVARASAGDPLFQKVLGTARGLAKGITDPSNPNTCYIVGGTTAATGAAAVPYVANTTFNVDKISVSNGAFTVAHAAAYQLVAGRSNFALDRCGSSKLIAVGGRDNTTDLSSMEVFDGTNWHTVSTANPSLSAARYNFAFAPLDTNYTKFIVAGGRASGGLSDVIDTINVGNSACAYNTDVSAKVLQDGSNNPRVLAAGRELAVAFPTGTANQFMIAGGDLAGALASTNPTVTVTNWSTSVGNALGAGTTTNFTQTSNPVLVYGASRKPILIGGVDHAGTSTKTAVQWWDSANTQFDTAGFSALSDSRVLHVAEYTSALSGNGVLVTSGQKRSSGTTFPTTDEMP